MIETIQETPFPQVCAAKIFEISCTQLDSDTAAALWPKILQHKWLMSAKLGRDVGLRTACIDFAEHMEQAIKEYVAYRRKDVLVTSDRWNTKNNYDNFEQRDSYAAFDC